jgi:hypothetical protein
MPAGTRTKRRPGPTQNRRNLERKGSRIVANYRSARTTSVGTVDHVDLARTDGDTIKNFVDTAPRGSMPSYPSPPSQADLVRLFDTPGIVPPNTFELALVLGGTVSAGSYTAGVIDFLIEALDVWYAMRADPNQKDNVPTHDTVLKFIAGTSGGGVVAAIAARALAYDFPHVTRATPNPDAGTGNPFYDIWVNQLTLDGFLGTVDLKSGPPISLLDGTAIDRAAKTIETYPTDPTIKERSRPYLADPLRIILTLTNLRGVPYVTDFTPFASPASTQAMGETFVTHADYARFAVVYPGKALDNPREDEFVVGFENAQLPQMVDWPTFSLFARATSAFPIGFPPRPLVRPPDHYKYRITVIPSDTGGPPAIVPLRPDWQRMAGPNGQLPTGYRFPSVDGGATDNEPIELARTALCGVTGHNLREGMVATRAVLLVDPFAGRADPGPERAKSLSEAAGALVTGMIQQTRYDNQDMWLAANDDVYSRFMITPIRGNKTGDHAIASSGLGAFIGFASKAFMRHDYFLGRANCQEYLRTRLVLPEASPVFKGRWPTTAVKKHVVNIPDASGVMQRYLPLIPLFGKADVTEPPETWPAGALDPERYRDAIEARFDALVKAEISGGILRTTLAWLIARIGQKTAADFAIEKINEALKASGLS